LQAINEFWARDGCKHLWQERILVTSTSVPNNNAI
jgi:hypothetical protein